MCILFETKFCQKQNLKQNLKHMATFYLKSTFIACLFNSFIRLFHSTQEIFIARTPNYKNKAQPWLTPKVIKTHLNR